MESYLYSLNISNKFQEFYVILLPSYPKEKVVKRKVLIVYPQTLYKKLEQKISFFGSSHNQEGTYFISIKC